MENGPLKTGETKSIKIVLNKDAFSYYDEKKKTWVADSGKYLIDIGNSSKDIRVSKAVML
ncbi:fibronectin type III-like domain-contianing protein [Pedobacter rhodius]|uniref:Fibronectin type III-like domain-contianing protein n=1 Tax=Pedobacter rhodius TaxID=3004098 RepID=A0ABT4KWF9_9SPHI|nr:fibronectin type III-like domain-contianing protein [Pedobacter sp. SJ11]MCZ4222572.1 fibronectin type III-like domain-contianing protein [Pedobacter sp. SJ11]